MLFKCNCFVSVGCVTVPSEERLKVPTIEAKAESDMKPSTIRIDTVDKTIIANLRVSLEQDIFTHDFIKKLLITILK
jgi:hypothetical protein